MEDINVLRLEVMYKTLKEQRDEAHQHHAICERNSDGVAAHYWLGIQKDVENSMNALSQRIAEAIL